MPFFIKSSNPGLSELFRDPRTCQHDKKKKQQKRDTRHHRDKIFKIIHRDMKACPDATINTGSDLSSQQIRLHRTIQRNRHETPSLLLLRPLGRRLRLGVRLRRSQSRSPRGRSSGSYLRSSRPRSGRRRLKLEMESDPRHALGSLFRGG